MYIESDIILIKVLLIGGRILRDRLKLNELRNYFKFQKSVERNELKNFYHQYYNNNLKDTTFRWIIYDLKTNGIINNVGKGTYEFVNEEPNLNGYDEIFYLNQKKCHIQFRPYISESVKKIHDELRHDFPYLKFCIWQTKLLNEFMLHQPGKFLTIVEVETIGEESVFYNLKDKYSDVFLKPTQREMELYVYGLNESIIVKKLFSQAPIMQHENIFVPKLEKILIDLLIEKKFYYPFQGKELTNIYRNVFEHYSINKQTMERYATRRHSDNILLNYVERLI